MRNLKQATKHRENETLKKEISEACMAQSTALKQSQEVLAFIQPLQRENNQLREAIEQWKGLIGFKDEELEELATSVKREKADMLRQYILSQTKREKSSSCSRWTCLRDSFK